MCDNKSCYLCRNLVFFDTDNAKGFYCILTNRRYASGEVNCSCANYLSEAEE